MRGQRDSTIDLAWASESLATTYWGDLRWEGSDYRAFYILVDLEATYINVQRAAKGWKGPEIDKTRAKAEAQAVITGMGVPRTPGKLDTAYDTLIAQLTTIADRCTLQKTPSISSRRAPWDTPEVRASEANASRAYQVARDRLEQA